MLKCLGKGETLVTSDVMFLFNCYNVSYSSEDYRELNKSKSTCL